MSRGIGTTRKTHWLKVDKRFWDALASGQRAFDVRLNDRKFRVGDTVKLRCYDGSYGFCGGETLTRKIVYVMHGEDVPGIKTGYVVLGYCDG